MGEGAPRYWAFISYSHRDQAWAKRVHRSLERYRVPKRLRAAPGHPLPRRLFPIFRDREELPTSADLGAAIAAALAASRTLIVLCSRAAARSIWVNEEVLAFKCSGRSDRILCLIVDGEPNATDQGRPEDECFCPALRHEVGPDGSLTAQRAEPLAADARREGDGPAVSLMKLKAGVLGVDFDQLARRERHRRRLQAAGWSLAVAATLLLAWSIRWKVFQLQAREAASAAHDLLREDRADDALRTLLPVVPHGGDGPWARPLFPEAEAALDLTLQRTRLHAVLTGLRYETEAGEFSRDSRRLVTTSRDGTVRVWDPETGAETHRFFPPKAEPETTARAAVFHPDGTCVVAGTADGRVEGLPLGPGAPALHLVHAPGGPAPANGHVVHLLAFSGDGRRLVSGGWDGVAKLWAWPGGATLATFPHPKRLLALQLDEARGHLLTVAADGRLRIWPLAGGAPLATLDLGPSAGSRPCRMGALALAPDGRRLAATAEGQGVLLDLTRGKPVPVARLEHADDVRTLDFDRTGQRLLTASEDGTARMVRADTGELRFEVQHQGAVRRARFTPDGRAFVTVSTDRTGQVWDADTGRPLPRGRLRGHTHFLLHEALSPDGRWLLTTSSDMSLRVWDQRPPDRARSLAGARHEVRGAAFTPAGASVWTTGLDRQLRCFDAATGALLRTLPSGHEDHVFALAVDPGGHRLATGSRDGTARVLDLDSGRAVVVRGHEAAVVAVAFSPDGRSLATTSRDGTARLWNAVTGAPLPGIPPLRHPDPNKPVWHAAFRPDGVRLVTASHDGTALVWDVATGACRLRLVPSGPDAGGWAARLGLRRGPGRLPGALPWAAYSADGTRIATASEDGRLLLWNADTGALLGAPIPHPDQVRAVAFLPGGTLVSATADGTLRYWSLRTRRLLAQRFAHEGRPVTDLQVAPGGDRLVTASADGTARIFPARPDGAATVAAAETLAARILKGPAAPR